MEIVINKFPEDVITQILLRLSVKSLLRFKCISKAWYNIIKSPDFITMHFNYPIAENKYHILIKRCLQDEVTNVLSIHSNTESLPALSPNLQIPHLNHLRVQLFGPCNGLVCITDFPTIVLCNPATREFKLLPEHDYGPPEEIYAPCVGVGFGFDAHTNNYKLVRIVNINCNNVYDFRGEVYNFSTDTYRKIDYDLPLVVYQPGFDLFFHGATHWKGIRTSIHMIISFCLTSEVFQEFNFPDGCPETDGKYKSLTVLNESLAMLAYTDPWEQINLFVDVWVMKEYGVRESWIKKNTIGPLSKISHTITSWKNAALFVEKANGQLISIVIETQEVKKFDIFGFPTTMRALVYKESLVPIDAIYRALKNKENLVHE